MCAVHRDGEGCSMGAAASRFDGRRAGVVGGATGMGRAAAELLLDLGAEVVVMDYADVTLAGVKAIKVNLSDKASIDAAVDECGGPIHALLMCAGVADGTPNLPIINFIGHRHFIHRARAAALPPRGPTTRRARRRTCAPPPPPTSPARR